MAQLTLQQKMDQELRSLITEAIDDSFRDIGLDNEEVFELRKDLTFLREQRITCEQLRTKGLWYLISVGLAGLIGLLYIGMRGWINVSVQ